MKRMEVTTNQEIENVVSPSVSSSTQLTSDINTTTTGEQGAGTQLSASALLEILSSIVAAASTDGTGQSLSEEKDAPIQVQLQVNPVLQQVPTPTVEGVASDRGSKPKEKDKQQWHYHLGGVRQRRVPLSPEIKEALEVAYVSRIMSKNFRKEGQPEKERISKITGLEIEKVHEWFKNRRKKDKLLQSRSVDANYTRAKRGRKPILPPAMPTPSTSVDDEYISSACFQGPKE